MGMVSSLRRNNSFTLIELLIVIAIIGILAAVIIVSVTSAAAKARDVRRQQDLRELQTALADYYTTNGSYPNTGGGWQGHCAYYGSFGTSGSGGYIPNLAPTYIPVLPLDPREGYECGTTPSTHACYLYRSDGTDYKLMAFGTVETTDPTATNSLSFFNDPTYGNGACVYSIYTAGAASW